MDNRQKSIELALSGMPPREIVNIVNVAVDTVYQYLREARHEGIEFPPFKSPGRPVNGPLSRPLHPVIAALKPHAELRRISVTTLAHRLLTTIARDDLVDAVLDDSLKGPTSNSAKGGRHDPA